MSIITIIPNILVLISKLGVFLKLWYGTEFASIIFVCRVHSILDIGVICFQLWTGPDLKIAPFKRVLKNLLDTGPWD